MVPRCKLFNTDKADTLSHIHLFDPEPKCHQCVVKTNDSGLLFQYFRQGL